MKLSDLLEELIPEFIFPDMEISGLALDSRAVLPGDLFFAYSGTSVDGRQYISQAIQKGAVAILCESQEYEISYNSLDIPIIVMNGVRDLVGYLAAKFYRNPSQNMLVIGVTGTSGKTSITQLLAEALQKLGKKSATIGTIGYGLIGEQKIPCATTTPSPIELQKILHQFQQRGVEVVAMEVSSHALDQGRMLGIDFTLGIFTNLSRDHLDYHHSMEAYAEAKRRLFEMPGLKYGVFNLDDPVGMKLIEDFKERLTVCGYSIFSDRDQSCFSYPIIFARDIALDSSGINAKIQSSWGDGILESTLLGRFNILNLLAVFGSLCLLGYSFPRILNVLKESKTVPGRMQTFGGGKQPLFVVDYSHKPDALEKVLSALKEHCEGNLYCVFGCGGDRDRGKRPMMAQIAEQYSDYVIVTDDNVRTENPDQIFEDIRVGFKQDKTVRYEHDRKQAIYLAYSQAQAGDIIVLAGKGHEDYQIIGTKKIHLDEREIVEELLNCRRVSQK